MHSDDRAIETDSFDLDAHELLILQLLEQAIQHANLRPAIHAGLDPVPVPETLGQGPPLAAVLRDVQDRVDHLEVAERNVAALYRQKRPDPTELRCSHFHTA
jgi:hypothetical protein